MSGSTPLIDQIDFSSSQKEVIVNRVNNAEAPAAVFGIKTLVGLSLVLYGGTIDNAGTPTVVANQTITLSDNTTNYVKRTASGVASSTTSIPAGWPATLAGVVSLYTIVTASGVYTTITEWRVAAGNVSAVSTFTGGTLSSALNWAPTVTIASSATPAIGAAAGNYISITGTTTITGFDTIASAAERIVTFTGILTLTHNATSLILPAGANITTAAGDSARFISLGSGNWKCLAYTKADGTPLVAGGAAPVKVIQVACSDETTALTTGTGKVKFRMPYAMTVTAVRASLTTVSSSGNPAIDINEAGVSILSTTITIDSGEKTSTTAATAAVISDSSLADDAEISIDIDTAGTGATGLKVSIIGT